MSNNRHKLRRIRCGDLALLFSPILFTVACAPTTQHQNAGFLTMPTEWESRLAELESKASSPELWPANLDEAEEFIDDLGRLIGGLSPLAEANYFPRLAELRWSAIAFEALNRELAESGGSASDETLYGLVIQLRAIADERPERVDARLEQPDSSLMDKLLERANELEDQDIDRRLDAARQLLGDTCQSLGDGCQHLEHTVSDVEDPSINNAEIYEVLDYLNYYESARPARKREISSVRKILEDAMAALEADTLDKPRREYQAWALEQIWAFEGAFDEIKSDERVTIFNPIPDGIRWTEGEYPRIQKAMISHLLPIDPTLLDLPVLKRYQSGFDVGWGVLDGQDGRKAQTCVAIASAIVPKRTFLNFAGYGPQPDRFDESEQWKRWECEL